VVGLAQNTVLHFADATSEALYKQWLNRRNASRDLLVRAAVLTAITGLFVRSRRHADERLLIALPDGATLDLINPVAAFASVKQQCGGLIGAAAAALVAPTVCVAFSAALRIRWYSQHRERMLLAASAVQAIGAVTLRLALSQTGAASTVALQMTDTAWLLLAATQLVCALLVHVRFSVFATAQLLQVISTACLGAACGSGAAAAAVHYSRLVGFGWCAPALLAFGLDAYSRRSFELLHSPRIKGGGKAALQLAGLSGGPVPCKEESASTHLGAY